MKSILFKDFGNVWWRLVKMCAAKYPTSNKKSCKFSSRPRSQQIPYLMLQKRRFFLLEHFSFFWNLHLIGGDDLHWEKKLILPKSLGLFQLVAFRLQSSKKSSAAFNKNWSHFVIFSRAISLSRLYWIYFTFEHEHAIDQVIGFFNHSLAWQPIQPTFNTL